MSASKQGFAHTVFLIQQKVFSKFETFVGLRKNEISPQGSFLGERNLTYIFSTARYFQLSIPCSIINHERSGWKPDSITPLQPWKSNLPTFLTKSDKICFDKNFMSLQSEMGVRSTKVSHFEPSSKTFCTSKDSVLYDEYVCSRGIKSSVWGNKLCLDITYENPNLVEIGIQEKDLLF